MGEMLLCPRTGDLYDFAPGRSKWEPRFNSGMHFKAANEKDEKASRIISRPKFQVKEVEQSYELFISNRNESVCAITRDKVNHYLFKKVNSSFIVSTDCSWKPHPYVSLNHKRKLTILAEAETYKIIELKFIVGCLFEANHKNKDHMNMIKNFTLKMATEVRCNNYTTIPLAACVRDENKGIQVRQDDIGLTIYDEYTRRLENQISRGCNLHDVNAELSRPIDVYKHSGMAFRKETLTQAAACNSIRKQPTAKRYGIANDIAFMNTADRTVFRRRARQFKGEVHAAYDHCFSSSNRRSQTADTRIQTAGLRLLNIDDGMMTDYNLDEPSVDDKRAMSFDKIMEKQSGANQQYYSYRNHAFVERAYDQRSAAYLTKLGKKGTQRRENDTSRHADTSHISAMKSEVSY